MTFLYMCLYIIVGLSVCTGVSYVEGKSSDVDPGLNEWCVIFWPVVLFLFLMNCVSVPVRGYFDEVNRQGRNHYSDSE
jgi:hypothetical protein